MSMSFEELVKCDKDRELEKKYKNVRTALKLSLTKYISDSPSLERAVDKFSGCDITDKSSDSSKKSFIDDLLEISKFMEDAFNKIGDAKEGALAHRLASVSAIYMDRISHACYESKLNRFPMHKEKFAVNVTEEQEAKSVVPKMVLRSVKVFIDKYYFLLRQCSVNPKAKILFTKISDFRDQLHHFEWSIGHYINKLEGEYAKEIAPFYKDTKLALLRLRKLCEAIEAGPFGVFIKGFRDTALEMGVRAYIRYNPNITVANGNARKGAVIPIGSIIEKYDYFMAPIRQAVAGYDKAKRAMQQRSPLSENHKMFWDISSQITEFREGMHKIINEFSVGISNSNDDFKYFIYTVQNVLIPYMNQTKGEVNDSFVVGVNNLDVFFWKVMIMSIELGQEGGENMEEILGLTIRIKQSDIDKKAASAAEGAEEAGIDS